MHSHIGPKQFSLHQNCLEQNNIYSRFLTDANTPTGCKTKTTNKGSQTQHLTITQNHTKNGGQIIIPYTQGLCQSVKNI